MRYQRDFVFFNAESSATSEIYYNGPLCAEELLIQVSGTSIDAVVQGRNGASEDWVDLTCTGNTADGLKVSKTINAAGIWSPLLLPMQLRMVNNGTPGAVSAYAQVKGV